MEVTLTIDDALYNAGLLGFYRALYHNKIHVDCNKDTITFKSEDLKHFTSYYLDYLIYRYEHGAPFTRLISKIDNLLKKDRKEEKFKEFYDNTVKLLTDSLKKNSYVSGYEIIANRGQKYNFSNAANLIKTQHDIDMALQLMSELKDKLLQYKDVFLLKDIIYTRIQHFWGDVAFLNRQQNKEEFFQAYERSFTSKALEFESKDIAKKAKECCHCFRRIPSGLESAMSWINDTGVDIVRKTSNYWNYKVDSYLCPFCNIVYSCVPLGFTAKGNEGIFINQNSSFEDINRSYNTEMIRADDGEDLFYQVIRKTLAQTLHSEARKRLSNVQVIRRNSGRYRISIISKDQIERLSNCSKSLEGLSSAFLKVDKQFINLFDKVLLDVLSGKNLYPLLHVILKNSVDGYANIRAARNILSVQTAMFAEGDGKMKSKANYAMMKRGEDLRKEMFKVESNPNKIKTLTYGLLNSLKQSDSASFMDLIFRQYIAVKGAVPSEFLNVIGDDQAFKDLGYSFLLGLIGGNQIEQKEDE